MGKEIDQRGRTSFKSRRLRILSLLAMFVKALQQLVSRKTRPGEDMRAWSRFYSEEIRLTGAPLTHTLCTGSLALFSFPSFVQKSASNSA